MNKKFLSAILFGALMVSSTGTFVSCKDYDDDIDNLQEQINKLATKEDMTSQIATLQAALTTAAKDASDALAKATAAETAAKAADYAYTKKELTTDITKATQYDCGSTLPTIFGGFGTSVAAYGFDLSAQFSYQLGGKIYDGQYQALMHNGTSQGSAMHKDLLNAWSETNKNSDIPRLSQAAADDPGIGSQTTQDRFLTSSNYLCLNNLTLGYTFPKALIRPLELTNLRIDVHNDTQLFYYLLST